LPALLAPAIAVALLLGAAGAAKVVDPTMTVGALRAMGLPSGPGLVRVGAAAEVVIACAALVSASPVPFVLISISFLGFAAFVLAAMRRGTMIGSCGCFGRDETPPHVIHVVLDLCLAGVAAAAATFGAAPAELVTTDVVDGMLVVALAGLLAFLLYAAFVELPRVLTIVATAEADRAARRGP
jgi:hypothetical protein